MEFIDFALHTDEKGKKTVFCMVRSRTTSWREIRYLDLATFKFKPQIYGFTVGYDQRWSWTQGEERLFITNGADIRAFYSDGTGTFNGQIIGSPFCNFIEYFSNRLFAMNLANNPVGFPATNPADPMSNKIQWSKIGDYTDWSTVAPEHGGYLELYTGSVTPITGGKVLNDRLVVYKEDVITDIISTGEDNFPMRPETRVNGIGCLFPWTLQSTGQAHIFIGNDYMVYMWDGAQLHPIGQPVHSYIRRMVDTPWAPWQNAPFAALYKGFKEYHLFLQSTKMGHSEVLIYDYMRDTWTRDYFPRTGDVQFGGMFEIIEPGPAWTTGYDGTNYPTHYPMLLITRGGDMFAIDERILGDRQADPAGGMDMWWDTIDMYYSEDFLVNGTCQRVITSQKNPLNIPQDPLYYIEVIVDRGANVAASVAVTPLTEHVGFEFADFNVTSNVRRYRFHYKPEQGAARPTWRGWSDIYVPSGDFFPTKRIVPNSVVPPIGTD